MFDLQSGSVILLQKNFIITPNTPKRFLEKYIISQIALKDEICNDWTHYYCWLDIEEHSYVYAHIMFHGEHLESIGIFPQHQVATIPAPQPDTMELEEAQKLSFEWYRKFFNDEQQVFSWGEIKYYVGNDPIYSPPTVLIKFH